MHYHFKIHKEKTGFWADCVELEGCRSEGDNLEELKSNLQDALDLYLSEPSDSNLFFPPPKEKINKKDVIQVAVSPNVAFAYNLRKQRILNKMTQKEVTEKLGLKNLYSYQRLESAQTSNPALSTLYKIKQVFPKLKVDDLIEVS